MEKGYPPQESAPPYPGPPLNQPEMYPQPGMHPQSGMYPQPGMHPQPGMYPQPGAYPQPGMYPQQGFSPAASPPPGYQGGAPLAAAAAVPVTTVTNIVVTPRLLDAPGQTLCPHCHQTVITNIQHTPGLLTWAICAGLAFFGFFLCCCIPFCIDSCQDVEHTCPNCRRTVYLYKRM